MDCSNLNLNQTDGPAFAQLNCQNRKAHELETHTGKFWYQLRTLFGKIWCSDLEPCAPEPRPVESETQEWSLTGLSGVSSQTGKTESFTLWLKTDKILSSLQYLHNSIYNQKLGQLALMASILT